MRGLNAHFILESTMKTVSNRRSAALRNHLVPAALVTGIASSAWGADRLVPGQYASIQAAIDAAAHGDRVLVSPGTHGAFALGGKAITIRGEGPAGSAVIDALGVGRAVDASGVAVGEAILENLVIRNASLASSGPVGGADLYVDGVVNGADLGALLAYWGPTTSAAASQRADFNRDGAVDGIDLGYLLSRWGPCTN